PRKVSEALRASREVSDAAVVPQLTEAQAAAVTPVLAAIESGEHLRMLLHGVTGSGKTEIYLSAIAAVLQRGRQAIMMVPEIALTPQIIQRFAQRFPGQIAVLHSDLTPAQRAAEWRRIHAGQAGIVIGSRSAVFAPLPNLGLVVVDEEDSAAY